MTRRIDDVIENTGDLHNTIRACALFERYKKKKENALESQSTVASASFCYCDISCLSVSHTRST